jgi:hypothetical protein
MLSVYRNRERAAVGFRGAAHAGDAVLTYAGSGHWPHQEEPRRFTDDVACWLRGLQEAAVSGYRQDIHRYREE